MCSDAVPLPCHDYQVQRCTGGTVRHKAGAARRGEWGSIAGASSDHRLNIELNQELFRDKNCTTTSMTRCGTPRWMPHCRLTVACWTWSFGCSLCIVVYRLSYYSWARIAKIKFIVHVAPCIIWDNGGYMILKNAVVQVKLYTSGQSDQVRADEH